MIPANLSLDLLHKISLLFFENLFKLSEIFFRNCSVDKCLHSLNIKGPREVRAPVF